MAFFGPNATHIADFGQDDVVVGSDNGRRELAEEHRLRGRLQVLLGAVARVIQTDAGDLVRPRDWRQQRDVVEGHDRLALGDDPAQRARTHARDFAKVKGARERRGHATSLIRAGPLSRKSKKQKNVVLHSCRV